MNIDGRPYRSIWVEPDGRTIGVIDQTKLAHEFRLRCLTDAAAVADAISTMVVRGAPLIGDRPAPMALASACWPIRRTRRLTGPTRCSLATRPTAVNLAWALDKVAGEVGPLAPVRPRRRRLAAAAAIADEDVATCLAIGRHGASLIETAAVNSGPAGQHTDPLQRRLAGDGRLGHRAGAGLCRA